MIPIWRALFERGLKLLDLAAMASCSLAAAVVVAWPVEGLSIEEFLGMRVKVRNAVLVALLLVAWHGVLKAFGLYAKRPAAGRGGELGQAVGAALTGSAVLVLLATLLRVALVTPVFIAVFVPAVTAATAGLRPLARRTLLRAALRAGHRREVLIVGTNGRATAFARKLARRPELGCHVIGFADDLEWAAGRAPEDADIEILCGLPDLPALLRTRVVDEVLVFLPLKSLYEEGSAIVAACEDQGIPVKFPSALFHLRSARSWAEETETGPVITISHRVISGWPGLLKRAFDFWGAAALVVLVAPLLLGIALLVKLSSRGPVLFVQERLGLNKRLFELYKFRTMVVDAERRQAEIEHLNEASGPVFKIKNDPRVTTFGAFLRRTSLDELPQLFNVLAGDLSLVGPRPLPVRDYRQFEEDWHRRRFSVRPGITCLWQVAGRSDIPFERWMELDLEYIERWSLSLDLRILLQTPAVLLRTVRRSTGDMV